jgi:hypothetical protein
LGATALVALPGLVSLSIKNGMPGGALLAEMEDAVLESGALGVDAPSVVDAALTGVDGLGFPSTPPSTRGIDAARGVVVPDAFADVVGLERSASTSPAAPSPAAGLLFFFFFSVVGALGSPLSTGAGAGAFHTPLRSSACIRGPIKLLNREFPVAFSPSMLTDTVQS